MRPSPPPIVNPVVFRTPRPRMGYLKDRLSRCVTVWSGNADGCSLKHVHRWQRFDAGRFRDAAISNNRRTVRGRFRNRDRSTENDPSRSVQAAAATRVNVQPCSSSQRTGLSSMPSSQRPGASPCAGSLTLSSVATSTLVEPGATLDRRFSEPDCDLIGDTIQFPMFRLVGLLE
jgi:hypothetical protein